MLTTASQNNSQIQLLQHFVEDTLAGEVNQIEGTNEYLQAMINPMVHIAQYPDSPRNWSITKSVMISNSITIADMPGFTNNFRMFFNASGVFDGYIIERQSTGLDWYLVALQQPSQSLSDPTKYPRLRQVSSIYQVVSSTVAGGQFNLSGTINAVRMTSLPPKSWKTTYDGFLPYAQQVHRRANVPVETGVVALQQFSPYLNFRVPHQIIQEPTQLSYMKSTQFQADCIIATSFDYRLDSQYFLVYLSGSQYVHFAVSSDDADTKYSARFLNFMNAYQNYRLIVSFNGTCTSNPGVLFAKVYMKSVSDTGVKSESFTRQLCILQLGQNNVTVDLEFFAYQQISRIEILTTTSPGVWAMINQSVTISQSNVDNDGAQNSITCFNINAGVTGQQFTVTGVQNYEIVPGFAIMTDVQYAKTVMANFEDLEKARLVLLYLEEIGIGGVLTTEEYQQLLANLRVDVYSRQKLHNLSATSVGALLARGFKRLVQLGIKYGPPIYRAIQQTRNPNKAAINIAATLGCARRNYMFSRLPSPPQVETIKTVPPPVFSSIPLQTPKPVTYDDFLSDDLLMSYGQPVVSGTTSEDPTQKLLEVTGVSPFTDDNDDDSRGLPVLSPQRSLDGSHSADEYSLISSSSINYCATMPTRRLQTFGNKAKLVKRVHTDDSLLTEADTHRSILEVGSSERFVVSRDFVVLTQETFEAEFVPMEAKLIIHNTDQGCGQGFIPVDFIHEGVTKTINCSGFGFDESFSGIVDSGSGEFVDFIQKSNFFYARLLNYVMIIPHQDFKFSVVCANRSQNFGTSMFFAFEAAMLGFSKNNFYSGDSDPDLGYLPSDEMAVAVIKAKQRLDTSRPIVIKTTISLADPYTQEFMMTNNRVYRTNGSVAQFTLVETSTDLWQELLDECRRARRQNPFAPSLDSIKEEMVQLKRENEQLRMATRHQPNVPVPANKPVVSDLTGKLERTLNDFEKACFKRFKFIGNVRHYHTELGNFISGGNTDADVRKRLNAYPYFQAYVLDNPQLLETADDSMRKRFANFLPTNDLGKAQFISILDSFAMNLLPLEADSIKIQDPKAMDTAETPASVASYVAGKDVVSVAELRESLMAGKADFASRKKTTKNAVAVVKGIGLPERLLQGSERVSSSKGQRMQEPNKPLNLLPPRPSLQREESKKRPSLQREESKKNKTQSSKPNFLDTNYGEYLEDEQREFGDDE